jgi:soluble cytochrome b562
LTSELTYKEKRMMKRTHLMLTICTSLLLITACNRPQTPTSESSPTASPKAEKSLKTTSEQASKSVQSALDKAKSATEQASQKAQSTIKQAQSAADQATKSASEAVKGVINLKQGLQGLATGVSSTLTAVKSGDFTTAQQEFSQLQENWTKIGDTVKTKSDKVYQQINSQVTTVGTLLKQPNPDRTKLVTELQSLGKTLTNSLSQL